MLTRVEPFFRSSKALDNPRGRLLLISYHFPPGGSAGALRWQKMSHYAAERGWTLDVLAAHHDTLEGKTDWNRLTDLPPGMRVYGIRRRVARIEQIENRVWDVCKRLGVFRRRRSHRGRQSPRTTNARPDSLTPDEMNWHGWDTRYFARAYHAWLIHHRDGLWARDATRLAFELCSGTRYHAVISCGPPHMAHEVGRRVGVKFKLPFITDLRDPWSLTRRIWEPLASHIWFWLAKRHEARTARRAALVVTATHEVREAMETRYPDTVRIITVMNGFDREPVDDVLSDAFIVTYAGAIYLDRNPRPVLQAVRRVVEELNLTPQQFRLHLVGEVFEYDGMLTREIAENEGVEGFVQLTERQPHQVLTSLLQRSAVLVSLPQDSPFAIPSKIFEYMGYRAWLLVLSAPDSPTARLLRDTDADVVAPHDIDGMADALRARYLTFANGERAPRMNGYERFSRRTQAEIFFDALEVEVAPVAARPAPIVSSQLTA